MQVKSTIFENGGQTVKFRAKDYFLKILFEGISLSYTLSQSK